MFYALKISHVGRLIVTWPKSRAGLRLVGAGHAPFNSSPETCLLIWKLWLEVWKSWQCQAMATQQVTP